jgi:hypothetical protein
LPPQLALELANIDLCAFEQCFLLGALQAEAALVDAGHVVTFPHDGAGFCNHQESAGDTGGDL